MFWALNCKAKAQQPVHRSVDLLAATLVSKAGAALCQNHNRLLSGRVGFSLPPNRPTPAIERRPLHTHCLDIFILDGLWLKGLY